MYCASHYFINGDNMRPRPQNNTSKIVPFPRRTGREIAPRLLMHLAREIDEAAEQGLDTPAKRRAFIVGRTLNLELRDRSARA